MAQKTLTLYLGKADIEAFEDVFTKEATARLERGSTEMVDAPDFGDGAKLFIFVGDRHQPKWLTDVRRHFDVRAPPRPPRRLRALDDGLASGRPYREADLVNVSRGSNGPSDYRYDRPVSGR